MSYDHNDKDVIFLREVYIEIDDNEFITFISENCYNILGYMQEELVNKNISDYLSAMPKNFISTTNFEATISLKNGGHINIDVNIDLIENSDGDTTGKKLSLMDISKYTKNNNNEKRLIQMFEHSKDFIYRFEVYPEFKFTYLSTSVKEILGYTLEEYISNPYIPIEIVLPEYRDYISNKYNGNVDFSAPFPIQYKHKNGSYVWLEDYTTPIYGENGHFIAFEGVCRDVTDRKQLEEKLERLSYFDGLTGAYNKFYLDKQIHILNTEKDLPIGIIFCDLDNLKITNDIKGHEFGDKLIVNAFNLLKDNFTDDSIIARTGGDEFIVIIKDTSLSSVKMLFLSLCESVEQQNKHNPELKVKISIGYSFSETSIGVTTQFINIADKNMYKDKRSKKI
jgi:diguanylate cyclase (GGDEF)-like protein/PAS domain S-box-containing protein